jgi:two-component system NtrC family sensor kinase
MDSMGWWKRLHLLDFPEDMSSQQRYRLLRRNMIILMLLVTLLPLFLMGLVNYHEYQTQLKEEIVSPLRILVNKTKHSFELFLAERVSAVSFIASAYSFDQLADEATLKRIFSVMKHEFVGFVDLGLIDENGWQISYSGPYDLKGKNYIDQNWYHDVQIWGLHISDVFMGYRRYPYVVIAVQHRTDAGYTYTLRATIDTGRFNNLIASMGLDPRSDAFLINKVGVLQTPSKFYGGVLEDFPFTLPPVSFESSVFSLSVLVILAVVFRLTNVLVKRMRESTKSVKQHFEKSNILISCPPLGGWPQVWPMRSTIPWPLSTKKQGS